LRPDRYERGRVQRDYGRGGVRVGHTTLVEGADIRTGVTGVVPDEVDRAGGERPAALFVGNGFGKLVAATTAGYLGHVSHALPVDFVVRACRDAGRRSPGGHAGAQTRSQGELCSEINSCREGAVLYAFGFERVGVVVSDLYFVDPRPRPGQEGAEHGVRVEVRMLEPGELKGSIYSARPIEVARPVWRADLLETVSGPPGSLNRAHHHPAFNGWEPGSRVFDPELSVDPVGWVGKQLSSLVALLTRAGVATDESFAADELSLRDRAPEIMTTVRGLLDDVNSGKLGTPPAGDEPESARISWL
jgi:hypothetical protein